MSKKNKNNQGPFDDVEFSQELADTNDKEAMERMDAADSRANKRQKKRNK
ncbi:YfhD family protein [Bacillus solitudinis]|nr:YfhD family protein [Bacillus solitudinis]